MAPAGRISRVISLPSFWLCGFMVWFALLCLMSSISVTVPGSLQIPHLDKVVHSSYFTAGAAVLGTGLMLLNPRVSARRLFFVLVLVALVVGGFDEWHQTHTVGRSGNDLGDLTADGLGGVLGFFAATRLFRFARGRRETPLAPSLGDSASPLR
jgi:VanZ family protein